MAADKARYYLEQSIPELREYEKKKIFSKDEINAITKKRSDFEHRINASGCHAIDFIRYAQYEMNLDALYRKRVQRLGIRSRAHYGQRRIFFIFDRATRKFPGDIPIWLQYIEYAKKQKSNNIVARTLARALKLHPTKPALWIYAAQHSVEQNLDIAEGRSYMQRGLRFCNKSKEMWREYAKLEMVFVAKVFLRRALLGIDKPKEEPKPITEEEEEEENVLRLPDAFGDDMEVDADDVDTAKKDKSFDTMALENPDTNPALNGALAMAIFDQAMKEIPNDVEFALEFYNLFAEFGQLKCCPRLLEHVVKYMLDIAPKQAQPLWLGVQLPLWGVKTSDPAFPGRLSTFLSNMAAAVSEVEPAQKGYLYLECTKCFTDILKGAQDLDVGIRKVISASLRKYEKQAKLLE